MRCPQSYSNPHSTCTEELFVEDTTRQLRLDGVNYARASVALEGFVLDQETENAFARYVAGEVELDDIAARMLSRLHN